MTAHNWSKSFYVLMRVLLVVALAAVVVGVLYPVPANRGETGATGAKGEQGKTGKTGATGATGAAKESK